VRLSETLPAAEAELSFDSEGVADSVMLGDLASADDVTLVHTAPEPGVVALLLAGFAALGGRHWIRSKRI
jgi:hypothetical protein